MEEPAGILILKNLKEAGREVERNSGASLIDLGDGVVCCEFHAKMNAIGADLIAMMHKGLKRLDTDFDAMVIANQATNFSVGANLMLVLVGAQEQEWDELHMAVKQFQNVNLAIKYAPKPVVAAPQGMALGGGCEISLHAAKIHAAAEAYIGLVETGVGLIPGGGGTKEMLIRANENAASRRRPGFVSHAEADFRKYCDGQSGNERGRMPRTGVFAAERMRFRMNRERLVADAKQTALALGARRMEAGGNVLAGRRADDADQGAGRIVPGGGEDGDSSDGARWLRFRLRRARGAKAGEYSGGRSAVCAANGERAVRARPGARGVSFRCAERRRRRSGLRTR